MAKTNARESELSKFSAGLSTNPDQLREVEDRLRDELTDLENKFHDDFRTLWQKMIFVRIRLDAVRSFAASK